MSSTLYENFWHFVEPDVPVGEKLFFNLHMYTTHEGNSYYLAFFSGNAQAYLADRVLPGDTLIDAVSRELKKDFDIDKWQFADNTLFSDFARDTKGREVKRLDVYINVPYFRENSRHLLGMSMEWKLASYDNIYTKTIEQVPLIVEQPSGVLKSETSPIKAQKANSPAGLGPILDEVELILSQIRERTIKRLEPYTSLEPEEDEVFACFALFVGQNFGMNYNVAFVADKKLDMDWRLIDEGESFFPELYDYVVDSEELDRLSPNDYNEFARCYERRLFEWFADCWFSAGGGQCRVPTFFAFDKEDDVYDFKTGELIKDTEVASRILGYAVS